MLCQGAEAIAGNRGKSGLHETRVAGNARRAAIRGGSGTVPQRVYRRWRETLQARVKGCGKSAPGRLVTGSAWQTPPGARPNRGLVPVARPRQAGFAPRDPGWLLERAWQQAAQMNDCRPRAASIGPRAGDRTRLMTPPDTLLTPMRYWPDAFWARCGCVCAITRGQSRLHRREKVRDLIKSGAHCGASTLPDFTFAAPYGVINS